jgi:protein-disulfide isomerase
MSKEAKIISGVGIVFFALFAFLIYKTSSGPQSVADSNLLIGQNSHMTAKKEAKVNVVEFGDYQCPACGYANPIVEKLIETYKDNPNVNFVYRNFPLPQHSNAMVSAEAAEAAGAQGKFWEMHNMLYSGQNDWAGSSKPLDIFTGYAQKLGLDVKAFTDAVNQQKFQDAIIKDRSDGEALGINATPTFFVNGGKMDSVPSFEEFKKIIDSKLQ